MCVGCFRTIVDTMTTSLGESAAEWIVSRSPVADVRRILDRYPNTPRAEELERYVREADGE